MSEPRDWQTLYAAAMLESDSTHLNQRIERADKAIQARLRNLPQTSSGSSEQAELQSALNYLRRLREPEASASGRAVRIN